MSELADTTGIDKLYEETSSEEWEYDYKLVQRVVKGDMDAFEQIYDRYKGKVYSVCLRMTENSSTAEDITQDSFIQMYRKIGTYKGKSSFWTWFYRITYNEVLMFFRRENQKSKPKIVGDIAAGAEPIVSGTANPNKMSIMTKIIIDEAKESMAPGHRKVFELHDEQGYGHEEVATILACSIGTSKSQLHKARLKLRKLLKSKIPIAQKSYSY